MLMPMRGARNQHWIICSGTVEVEGLGIGEDTGLLRVEYGQLYETLGGNAGVADGGVELAVWTSPAVEPAWGCDVDIEAQDSTGFWVRLRKLDDEYYTSGDISWAWEVRGMMA